MALVLFCLKHQITYLRKSQQQHHFPEIMTRLLKIIQTNPTTSININSLVYQYLQAFFHAVLLKENSSYPPSEEEAINVYILHCHKHKHLVHDTDGGCGSVERT